MSLTSQCVISKGKDLSVQSYVAGYSKTINRRVANYDLCDPPGFCVQTVDQIQIQPPFQDLALGWYQSSPDKE